MGHLWFHYHQTTSATIPPSAWTNLMSLLPTCSSSFFFFFFFVRVKHLWAEITKQTAWMERRPGWAGALSSKSVSYLAPGSHSFDSFMANTKENQYEGKGLTFHFLKSDPLRANHQAVFISLEKWQFFYRGRRERNHLKATRQAQFSKVATHN